MRLGFRRRRDPVFTAVGGDPLDLVEFRRQVRRAKEREVYEATHRDLLPTLIIDQHQHAAMDIETVMAGDIMRIPYIDRLTK